ncbi:MAG TPA: hypothetical protein VN999_04670 [Thermoanaerobaculia bacterium]|nr:hypothetical protein [Thermoanaerobaculia bacterium]
MAKHDWERWFRALLIFFASAALVIGLGAVAVIYFTVRDATEAANAMARLKVVLSYEILILTFFYGFMVLLYMAAGEIDLSALLSEPKGTDAQGNQLYGASMSRFQLLIFTFVIALSLLSIIIANGATKFPAIPSEILVLLGISASTYAVGKGIQSSGSGSGGNGGGGTAGGTSTSGPGSGATSSNATPKPGPGQ